jgi:hypothetical protein
VSQEAGPFMMAFQSVFSGVAQANADKGAAAADLENARLSELQGAFNVADIRRRGRAVQGEAVAALAEGGASVGDGGSARDLIYQNALDIELAAMNARYSAAGEARGYRSKAAQEKQAARNALIGGFLGAGAAAVTGISNARSQAREDAAYRARYNAFFPGGQQLPVPPSFSTGQGPYGP